MKHLLVTCISAAVCLSASASASVLEPENVGELVESATLNFTSAKGGWKTVPEPCPVLEEALKAGVGARKLPAWLRGKGFMVPASCRIADAGGCVDAPDRILLVQDVAAPDVLLVVSVPEEGAWTYAAFRRDADGEAPGLFWYWKIDRVERFPE